MGGFGKMLSVRKTDLDYSLGFIDPRYPEILRKANSAHPTKYPLLELELVMRELFQEDKLDSVIIASEKLKNFDSEETNFLRLNCYFFLTSNAGGMSYYLRLRVISVNTIKMAICRILSFFLCLKWALSQRYSIEQNQFYWHHRNYPPAL